MMEYSNYTQQPLDNINVVQIAALYQNAVGLSAKGFEFRSAEELARLFKKFLENAGLPTASINYTVKKTGIDRTENASDIVQSGMDDLARMS